LINIYDNFLTEKEINDLFLLIEDKKYEKSKVGFNEISNGRTSTQINVSKDSTIRNLCKRLISDNSEFEVEANIVKYEIGQYVGLHHDEVDWDEDEEDLCEMYSEEVQYRKYSIIIFLTDDFEGGILSFPLLDIKIKPKIGKLVMFENVFNDLQVNKSVIHESSVITKGVKIVLVIFISVNKITKVLN
jgi:prolyl 4-hydroxylase